MPKHKPCKQSEDVTFVAGRFSIIEYIKKYI